MKLIKNLILGAILSLLFISCTKAPITGRNQLIMVSPQQEVQLGYQSAKQILSKAEN